MHRSYGSRTSRNGYRPPDTVRLNTNHQHTHTQDAVEKDTTPDGRLPDATKKEDHLRDIFYRMGFVDREIVALSGGALPCPCWWRCNESPLPRLERETALHTSPD